MQVLCIDNKTTYVNLMAKSNKFGTFGGVFTPSILTILGVIMFLRLPMIIGQAGLIATIGIIIVAHIISLSTGLSVSSIATDKKVKAGGTYYMISRSLGLPIGGTLGLALFVGLSFSVSLYLIGFSESFLSYWGYEVTKDNIRIAGTIILLCVTTITFISTSLAIKTQYVIMAAIVLSLVSIFFGQHDFTPAVPLIRSGSSTVSLMVLFGIFFPAVTGFEAGVSMSGDLKDAKKSIPIGSISAILVGLVAYIGLSFFFAYTVDGDLLANDSNVLLKISWVPQLVVAGIWGATLSSALGSILGAPRILQATAVDGIMHRFFSRGIGKTNEPRNALLLTFIIAEAGILIGELDVIARIVSIFFITTYGFLNLSCAFERWTSADFRPDFKTPIWVSLLGAVACFLVMIQLDILATIGASILLGLVFLYLKRKELSLQTGDTWSGVWASLVKSGLEYLSAKSVHNRNWRPNILLFHGAQESRPYLLKLGKALTGKLGILTAFDLIISGLSSAVKNEEKLPQPEEKETGRYFTLKYATKDLYEGIDEISRVYGFSGIKPNTILMGWIKDNKRQADFGNLITNFNKSQLNSIFLNYSEERGFGSSKSIDIWWSGYGSNLSFAISIIRYLSSDDIWKDMNIRLFVPITNALLTEKVYATLERIIDQYRIAVEIKLVDNSIEKLSTYELIKRESSETDLTIVGLPNRRYENMDIFMDEANKLLPLLGSTLLINASNLFEEYDLELNEKTTALAKEEKIDLVQMPQFLLPMLTEEINRVDTDMHSLANKFFDRTFLPHFLESNDWIQNIKESIESTTQNFIKANEINDQFRRNKAYFKIKNEFYFNITSLFEKKQENKFSELKNLTEDGIQWYIHKMDQKISAVTNSYRIEHHTSRFKLNKGDSIKLKRYKTWKKLTHPFAKKTIPIIVHYRTLSEHYLKNRQIIVLHQILDKFETWSYQFIYSLKNQINAIDDFINQSGANLISEKLTTLQIEKVRTKLLSEVQQLEREVKAEQTDITQNLLSSFRREIVGMGYDLEEVNVNQLIKQKTRVSKIVGKARKLVLAFPEQWYDKVILYYNKLNTDVRMTSFMSRASKLIDDYESDINVNFYQKLIRDIDQLKNKIVSHSHELELMREVKVEFNGDSSIKVFKEFELLNHDVMKLVDILPKEMALPFEENSDKSNLESVTVPVAKISRHFFESRFVGPIADRLGKAEEELVRIIHEIKDQMSLTRFSIDNLDNESELGSHGKDAIISDMVELLDEKKQEIDQLNDSICEQFKDALQEAFDPLSSYKLIESSKALTVQLRDYKSRRIRDIIGYRLKAINTSIMKQLARIWYTKSEGVLLAKRLIETEKNKSRNEKILDIIEHVSPSAKVMNTAPHYYKSLFSGRSNISEELWVGMIREQAAFTKAIERYHSGIKGGIIVTGERNCGKTNLCQIVLKKQFKVNQIFHIFPPVDGSLQAKDFEHELSKATGILRDKSEIFNTVPFGSVFVIHDMELWWERSPKGLELIREIMQDIDRYSKSYLFVINMNIFAYELVNNVLNLQDHMIGVIQCQPLDSESLKSLIMKRHKSSGLSFLLEDHQEENLSHLRLAKLFTKYFDYSKGNPGVTLNAWLSNISQYKNEQLFIEYPNLPDFEILSNIDEEALMLLQQISMHKRMDFNKLARVFASTEQEMEIALRPLRLNGLVVEKSDGVFIINPYVDPLVVSILKQKELL